jgi:hypothetical protein
MERRALLSTYVVNTTSDLDRAGGLLVGQESLRQAIEDVNADSTPDVIDFNLGSGGHQIIALTAGSSLPAITNTVTIDGTSQPGYSGSPIVEIHGAGIHVTDGLNLQGANSLVKGLVINNVADGFLIYADGTVIQGNFIGTDWTGTVAVAVGTGIFSSASNVLIGGTSPGQRNLISGAIGAGIAGESGTAVIQGNKIGTDVMGCYAIGNANGIFQRSASLTIGGATSGAGNLISGNGMAGNQGAGIDGDATIQGNKIGTDITGTKTIPNFYGIVDAGDSLIGGTEPGAGNLISGNATVGIAAQGDDLIQGNFIGTDVTGTVALGNGVLAGGAQSGISGGTNDTIGGTTAAARNIISGNPYGISSDHGDHIEGNYIGTDVTGEVDLRGAVITAGIFVATGCTIGGTAAGAGNLISGNESGGIDEPTDCLIQGNFIGTNKEGTEANGNNGVGIDWAAVSQSIADTIGGTAAGAGNLISGNSTGILMWGDTGSPIATNLVIQGNLIGTDVTGSAPLGNQFGIVLGDGLSENLIGSSTSGGGNVIAYNGEGVLIETSFNGAPPAAGYGNSILGNSIYNNNGQGCCNRAAEISLISDPSNPPPGPNGFQAAPVLDTASRGATTTATGSLTSSANNTFRIEFFASPGPDAAGNPEGRRYLGSVNVMTDASGNAAFTATGLGTSSVGEAITATATVLTGPLAGSTSEFSRDATTIVLSSSSNIWTYGQTQVTANVAAVDPANGAPGGTVQVVVDGVDFGLTTSTSTVGTISLPIASLGVGTHTITALYSGDSRFEPSTSASLSLQVTPAPLTITADNLTKEYGAALTFAGTEFTASGLFFSDHMSSVTLTSAGAAPTATVAGSPYDITPSAALGSGLSNYNISYVAGALAVVGDPTSTSLSASPAAPLAGEAVTFTATVSSNGPFTGYPIGTVTFYDGYSVLGTASLATSSGATTASLTTAALAVGAQSVSAVYGGDSDFAGSSSVVISTFAGVQGTGGHSGDGGPATAAQLALEAGDGFVFSGAGGGAVAVDAQGNVFIADTANNVIREVRPDLTINTVAGGGSDGDPAFSGPATAVALNQPNDLAVDGHGNLLIADTGDNLIRELRPDGSITTVAGNGMAGYSGDGGPVTAATLNQPYAVAVDAQGDLFIADTLNNVIREVRSDGTITTVAGDGQIGSAGNGNGGPATSAALSFPQGVAVDGQGDLFIANSGASEVREVRPNGIITTLTTIDSALGLPPGTIGPNGPEPTGLAVDAQGDLFITDTGDGVILGSQSNGTITTVAGNLGLGFGYSGDGGPPTSAALNYPGDAAVDSSGDLFIADSNNNVIRRVGGLALDVSAVTSTSLQSALSGSSQNGSGGAVTLQTTSGGAVNTAIQAVNGVSNPTPSTPQTVTLDLAGTTATATVAFAASSGVELDLTSSSGNGTVQNATINGGTIVVAASVAPVNWTVDGGNVTVEGSASAGDFTVDGGTVTLADGTVVTGNSPSITINGGTVILHGATAQTATNSPTIVVNGGSLVVRNSTIQESTGYAQAAILITGGMVDLGTTSSPGGNTFNVNGTGTLIQNKIASPVAAIGDTFENNGVVAPSIYVLNPTASGAVTLSGNSSIKILGPVVVDSSSSSAISAGGNSQLTASAVDVLGGITKNNTATVGIPPATGVSVSDPLAGLASPSTTGLTNYGSVSLAGSSSLTICQGIYSQIKVSGNASLTMKPGIYIIEGGGFTVTGNASVAGAGVMIYNAGSNYPGTGGNFGGITFSGSGTFHLSAPTSGTYAGILIFQSRQNTRALSFSGNAMAGMGGTIYAANALLSMSGNASLQNALDVGMLNLSGNVALTQVAGGSDGSGDTSGIANTLLAGNLSVYVNNSSGLFTTDQLARIQDAINTWDALLVPSSVTITEVSDPSLANVVIDTGTTSACGGMANGVLGCYNEPNNEITMISGWNWYAGSDPTQIGANQYDFETTVLHELGHALGLGGSTNPSSPMYEILAAGVAARTVTTQDLNIPDPPEGADPQIAAGFRFDSTPAAPAPTGVVVALASGSSLSPAGLMPLSLSGAGAALTSISAGLAAHQSASSPVQPMINVQAASEAGLVVQGPARETELAFVPSPGSIPTEEVTAVGPTDLPAVPIPHPGAPTRPDPQPLRELEGPDKKTDPVPNPPTPRITPMIDLDVEALAFEVVRVRGWNAAGTVGAPALSSNGAMTISPGVDHLAHDEFVRQSDRRRAPGSFPSALAAVLLAAGFCGHGARGTTARKRNARVRHTALVGRVATWGRRND